MKTDFLEYGDCIELMLEIPDESIDLILSDPPYGLTACKWDTPVSLTKLWKQYKRIIKKHGAIVLFGKEPFTSELVISNRKGFKHRWVWDKRQSGSFQLAKYMPLQITEDIVVFTGNGERVNYYPQMRKGTYRKRGGAKATSKAMGKGFVVGYENYSDEYYPTNLLQFSSFRKNRLHPTEKPIALLEYLIKTYSLEGDTVLDTFVGSGSTAIACLNTHRHYIGYEIEKEFYETAKNRIANTLLSNEI